MFLALFILLWNPVLAEDGYQLWLRYNMIEDEKLLNEYRQHIRYLVMEDAAPELEVAKRELISGIKGLLGIFLEEKNTLTEDMTIVAGTPDGNTLLDSPAFRQMAKPLGREGFRIFNTSINETNCLVILAQEPAGVLYGSFHFLMLIQTHTPLDSITLSETPKIEYRILNHWDNLDRTVERGYAGFSIWDWHKLPDYIDPRYIDYARANASIGINGTVLTNVNANARVLDHTYLIKVAALADVFRPYGIRVYLTARFNAPVELGGLQTADPKDHDVIQWWDDKINEIYALIPDFGGFLVKANSEGQPGPQNYGRTHAGGANMLATALKDNGGIVMWRAFVYDNNVPEDRAKQAYNEFVPLDGQFRENVFVQVKNGAIDFQPREPFHPLFGAMKHTQMSVEFQITQEYLGQGTHLVYLAPLFKECLDSDTWVLGEGSEVGKVIDGSMYNQTSSCMAGVSNIGTDRNWTGHHFAQANWYAFGRLAWNHNLGPGQIADEWIKMTFTNNPEFVNDVRKLMLSSHEICVNYMTPIGLHHIMGRGHHYGPGPWISGGREDWTSVYYHRADSSGIGFNRTGTGSNALGQYSEEIIHMFDDPKACPEQYLLWFHHLPWDFRMKSGRSLWEELCRAYYYGADSVRWMEGIWEMQKDRIDQERFEQVGAFLKIQAKEATWWRNACILYFQQFSNLPVPKYLEEPEGTLEGYMKLRFPYAPGIRPRW